MVNSKHKLSRRQQVYEDLIRRIKNEEWCTGTKLPSLSQLSKDYGVSVITVVNAMKQAESEGYVESRQGSGTYVTWSRESIFFPFVRNNRSRPVVVTHTLLYPTPLETFVMRELADCFMRVFSEVDIRLVPLKRHVGGDDPYIQKITDADMPCSGEFYWHAMYAKLDALIPLESLPGFQALKGELLPQALYETCDSTNESHYHAIYLNFGLPNHILVKRPWAEEMGVFLSGSSISWTQIFRLLKHAAHASQNHTYSGALALPCGWHGVKNYLELLGQSVFGQAYRPNDVNFLETIIESDSALAALQCLEEFLAIHPQGILMEQPNENFAIGRVGMLPFACSWIQHLIVTLNADSDFMAMGFPAVPGTSCYRPFYSGSSVGIFRDGIKSEEQLHATWNWIKFLLSCQAQELATQSMTLPVRADAVPYIAEMNPEVYQLALQALKKAVPQPDAVGMRRKFADLSPILTEFLTGEVGATQCLQKLRYAVSRSRTIDHR